MSPPLPLSSLENSAKPAARFFPSATQKLVALFAAAVVVVGLMVLASFQAFRQMETSATSRNISYEMVRRADAFMSELKDAVASQRGYVLTGDDALLQAYQAGRERISGQLEALRRLGSNSPSRSHLDNMVPLVEAKLAYLEQAVRLRRLDDTPAAIAFIGQGRGTQVMDSVRAEMAGVIRLEESVLALRDAEFQASMRRLFGVIVTASVFTLLFALLFIYLIYREAQNRIAKLVQLETQGLLEIQEEMNRKLRQANATLQVNEEKLAVTLNSIGDAVITTDAAGRVTLLNPLAELLTGWSRGNAAGRPVEEIFNIINQDTRKPSVVPVMDTLAKGTQHGLANHTILIALDGSESTIADSCAPIRDRDGQVVGAVLVFRDVTHEDEARQALRDQQFYTRSLIESNVDALITTNPSGTITDANTQMEQLTGRTRDELIGTPFKDYFTDPARADAGIRQVLGEQKVNDYELTALARDGRETSVSLNATTFHNRYSVLQGVFAAARDVTDRNRLDQALREKNDELESARSVADKANLAKSEFLSSMSHELRTPLNAILGFAQLMGSSSPPPPPVQKRNIDQILKAGWYLLELINEILDLALIESGKVTMSREPVSLAEVMAECRAMIEPQALKRAIGVSFPHFDAPCFVHADRTRVKQVLINLTFNAIKYNKPGGTVAVDCVLPAPDRIRISIRDTGAGLAPDQLAQLFQPFNRLGKEVGAEEGTGMGLVVTKRLVELMGGTIGVESTVGLGSTFWIELSVTSAPQFAAGKPEPAPRVQTPLPHGTPQRTLLYVEDNPANLELVEQLVARRPDLRLLSAADGILGIELARSHLPDVILMDINLPGISGREAMARLRADPATSHIPIIALSANAMPRDIEKGLEAGFFSYLTKPIKVGEFMEALDVALIFAQSAVDRTAKKVPA
jgi:PAS domain S-box-containing protein